MARILLALALTCITAGTAFARDLCIQIDTGGYAGWRLVLKKAKLTRGTAPVQGYVSVWDYGAQIYRGFSPMNGQSIVDANGHMIIGVTYHEVELWADGSGFNVLNDHSAINLGCSPGANGRIDVLDSCSAYVFNQSSSAHVIPCDIVDPLP